MNNNSKKLSEHQKRVLKILQDRGSKLMRFPGGFWVTLDAKMRGHILSPEPVSGEFWTDIRTIRAMERKGVLERTFIFTEEWRDTRQLTKQYSGGTKLDAR